MEVITYSHGEFEQSLQVHSVTLQLFFTVGNRKDLVCNRLIHLFLSLLWVTQVIENQSRGTIWSSESIQTPIDSLYCIVVGFFKKRATPTCIGSRERA